GEPALLASQLLLADDFHITLQFRLGKDCRGAIEIRAENRPALPAAAVRVELAPQGPIVLTGTEGGRSLPRKAAAATIKADVWNKLEIIGAGQRIGVRLNAQDVVALDNVTSARRSIVLESLAPPGQEIRFRNLDLR